MTKLNKRTVDSLQHDPDKELFIWDEEMPCFGLRIFKSGKKSYLIQYRHGGRSRRMSLGRHGTITPDEARTKAKKLLGRIADGENPAEDRSGQRNAPTLASACERFIDEHAKPHCKPKTVSEYKRALDAFVKPVIGTHRVMDITRDNIANLHLSMKDKPYQANRTLAVLSALFNQCELWGLRPDGSNPCRHVKKYKEQSRERFLSEDEVKRLWETLDQCERDGTETPAACNAYRLLILTGCRLNEIQTLKWEYIKEDGIYLPDSKTGAKKVYIGRAVHDLLAKIEPTKDNPYVIPGRVDGQHLTDLQHPWRRIRKKAELDGLRIHDLRHSFASIGLANGLSLTEIGKLLGHSQVQTTARYAHLAEKIATEAADQVSNAISKALVG